MSDYHSDEEMMRQFDGDSTSDENASDHFETLTLPFPREIQHNGEKYTSLKLREPTFWEITQSSRELGSDINASTLSEASITLVRLVSNVPNVVIDQLSIDVLNKACDFVMSFEERAREEAEERASLWGDNIPQTYTLSFDPPMTGGGKTLDVMELSPPTVHAVRRARQLLRKNTIENINRYEALLLELVSKWPKAAILKLPISQKIKASEYLNAFLHSGQQTGKRYQQT